MPRFFEDPEAAAALQPDDSAKGRTKGKSKHADEPAGARAEGDPGPLPVDQRRYQQLIRGKYSLNPKLATKIPTQRKRLANLKERNKKALIRAVRSEVLLTEQSGFIEPEENEETYQITQKEIQHNVDITSASKHFDLNLNYGPYRLDFSRNGRQLVIGGRKGHVASFDWLTKELKCEFNVQESVHDVQFLHLPSMFAVAQKDWVYMYDDRGTELHCIRKMYHVQHMDFLPYHFLLVSASDNGFLTWLDVSTGEIVSQFRMDHAANKLTCMTQNRANAIIHTGHPNGTVALWSPNVKKPLIKLLANPSTIRGIAVDSSSGNYMATAGVDRSLKIFDLRNYKCLYNYKLRSVPGCLSFSQTDMLAVGLGQVVEVYNQVCRKEITAPYMRHRLTGDCKTTDLSFVNYEDVLGLAHESGYSSLLIPGSGEANFDAFEANPFMTTSQKREIEVKALLEKISPDLISLDPRSLSKVDVDGLQKDREAARKELHVKIRKIELKRKNKKKATAAKRKEKLRELKNRDRIEKLHQLEDGLEDGNNAIRDRHLSPSTTTSRTSTSGATGAEKRRPAAVSSSDSGIRDIYSRFKSRPASSGTN
jgi:U3 small nucleolar RNA-associated protein 7